MTDAKKIIGFIKTCCNKLGLSLENYFYSFMYEDEDDIDNENGEWVEMPWTDQSGNLYPVIIPFASEILGVSEEDILACNEKALQKWFAKYPYFEYLLPYMTARDRSFYNSDAYDTRRLLTFLFNEKINIPCPPRFNYQDVKTRLVEQLKDLNKTIPGTYHEGATITQLQIYTETIFHFDLITKMANSFLTMVDRAIHLFLKAVKEDLVDEELHEYNLLVSVLGLRDRYYVGRYLYHSELIKARELYVSTNEDNIRNSIVFERGRVFKPWYCAEFIEDKDLVKRYLSAIPEAKGEMREFAVGVTQFDCRFTWSDAQPVWLSPEDEAEMDSIDEMFGDSPIKPEERAKERCNIYVPKNEEELDGLAGAAGKLLDYCRPERLGGLECKMPEYSASDSFSHLQFLLGRVRRNNNYIANTTTYLASSGGGV